MPRAVSLLLVVTALALGSGCPDDSADLDEDSWTTEAGDCDDENAAVHPGAEEIPYNGVDEDCALGDLDDVDDDGHPAEQAGGDDCDDQDPNVFAGAVEACNGQDDNCDGTADEDLTALEYLPDGDGDGFGAGDLVLDCSAIPPEGHVPAGGLLDCDDEDAAVNPDGIELCNGLDDNCDASIDEDFDGDGDGVTLCGPDGDDTAPADNDCDDANPQIYPGAPEQCNGIDDDCSGSANDQSDGDGDGFTPCGADDVPGGGDDDCDDAQPTVFPGNSESCDALDNDCNSTIDDGFDVDTDGVTICGADGDGLTAADNDCDDADPAAFPGNPELCDTIDNDCSGVVDDGFDADADSFTVCGGDCDDTQPVAFPGNLEICDAIDNDCNSAVDDGFDVDADAVTTCGPDGDPLTLSDNDCDDAQPLNFPGNTEVCDGIDNDCDGNTDPGGDLDGDGVSLCGPDGLGGNADDDCDDTQPLAFPGNAEICDAIDNDCNSTPDDGFDLDTDSVTTCGPDGDVLVTADNDCDDNQALNFPGNTEVCDALDNDCDAALDNGFDLDTDGVTTCGPDGDVGAAADNDCDDAEILAFPGNPEFCDALDNDCDAAVDNGFDGDLDGVTTCGPDGDVGAALDNDCDDAQILAFPGNTESCDVVDNDCDSVSDDGFDLDTDGVTVCGPDGDASATGDNDCDDNESLAFPGNPEACDAVDNDCNTTTDEGFDVDIDGFTTCGSDGDIAATADNDCDDDEPFAFPGNPELCDLIDNDCDGLLGAGEIDGDGDAVTLCGGDCDDAAAERFPLNPEVCDGLDNDCDTSLPADELDDDADGYLVCAAFIDAGVGLFGGDDCDDLEPDAFPGNAELCDGLDNDCANGPDFDLDGEVDLDSDLSLSCMDCDDLESEAFPGNPELCDGLDNDCAGGVPADEDDSDADTFRVCANDCEDDVAAVYPGAAEDCDGLDTDCVGGPGASELDADSDLYLECGAYVDLSVGFLGGDDCADTLPDVHPGATEVCEGRDSDCSTGSATPPPGDPEADDDTDLYLACTSFVDVGLGFFGGDDCLDIDPDINPGADEICDTVDNDCDTAIDAADGNFAGVDADGDGANAIACGGSDCDDADAAITPFDADLDGFSGCSVVPDCDDADYYNEPGGVEYCDGLDNNCDGLAQDTATDGDGDGQTGVPCGGADCDDSDPHVFDLDAYGSGYHRACLPAVYPGFFGDWSTGRVTHPWILDDVANTGLYYLYHAGHFDPGSSLYPVGVAIGVVSSLDGVSWSEPDSVPLLTRSLVPGAFDGAQLGRPSVVYLPGAARPYLMYYHGRQTTVANLREVGLATATSPLGPFERLDPEGNPLSDSVLAVGSGSDLDARDAHELAPVYGSVSGSFNAWYSGFTTGGARTILHASSADGVVWTKTDTAAAGSPDPVIAPAGGSAWDGFQVSFPFVMANSDAFDTTNPYEVFYSGRATTPTTMKIGVAWAPSETTITRCTASPVVQPGSVNRADGLTTLGSSVFFDADDSSPQMDDGVYRMFYSGAVADTGLPYGSASGNYSGQAAYVVRADNTAPELLVNPAFVGATVTLTGTVTDDAPNTVTLTVTYTHTTLPNVVSTVVVSPPPSPSGLGVQTSLWASSAATLGSGTWTATVVAIDGGCSSRRQSIGVVVP